MFPQNETIFDLESLYEEYFPQIYNYIFYRLMHREETEDLVSTVFLKIARNLDSFDEQKGSISSWVFSIAGNALKDYYRTRKVNLSLDEETSGLYEPFVDFEEQYNKIASPDRKMLYFALRQLSLRERTVVYYKYFLNMQNREISRILDINESTVSSLLLRSREKMRTILHKEI